MIETVGPQVDTVAFGRPATLALAAAIERAQSDRALAPVTVVVASNFAGLAARRTLGALRGRGLVNVGFVTPLRLAELLAADVLVERHPLTNPVLGSAVRRALAADPRPFGEAAGHVATETAVARLFGELSRLTPDALEAVRSDSWGDTVVGLFERVSHLVAGFHDEDAVVRAVLARSDLAAALQPFGHIVWHLPQPLSPAQVDLVAAALALSPSTVIVGLTGDGDADEGVVRTCRQAGVAVDASVAALPTVTADRIVSVTDADEEVRSVVSSIMQLAADGVALDRVGVFYPVPRPYVREIEHHLLAAGLPGNGPSIDRLAECAAGRTLRSALALADDRWRRDRVMALVAGAPVRFSGGRAHPGAWERVSRDAGVVRDLADWHRKLDAYMAATAARAEAGHEWARRNHEQAGALRAFVDELAALVEAVRSAPDWAGKSAAARMLLASLLGPEQTHLRWPERERDDLDRVIDALARLATLDVLEPSPSHAAFVRALDAELEASRGRSSPYGTGIVYGPLSAAAGHDLDAVFVMGLAEGLCPVARRDEALLPERVRALAGGQLSTPDDAMSDQHRALLAALASAPPGRRTITFPRGDLRSNRHNLPSRWLLDSASALAGRRIHSTDFPDLSAPLVDVAASFSSSLHTDARAASVDERDLAVVGAYASAGGDPADVPTVAPVARSVAMQRARRSASFTEFDGNLTSQPVPSPVGDTVLSATRLERWAQCGFRYFLHDVLGLSVRDDPERIVMVSAVDRGSVIHNALERFLGEVLEAGPPAPHEPWSPHWRDRLHAIADDCFDELESRGRTGRPLRWRLERHLLHDMLAEFLAADDEHRRVNHATPLRVELPFGDGDADPVELALDDGRVVRFRGKADRVDVDDSGRHLVLDYKTGKGAKYAKLDDDPVLGGTTLQLGLYAEAARQRLGATEMAGHYWLLEPSRPQDRFAGYDWTTDKQARFRDVLHTIVEGIEHGVFAQVPDEWNVYFRTYDNCRHCDFDSLCPASRGEHAEAKAGDPALAVRVRLTPLEGGHDDGSGADEVPG